MHGALTRRLRSASTVTGHSDTVYSRWDPGKTALHSSRSDCRKNAPTVLPQMVAVIPDKESLRNCHQVMIQPSGDPGTEETLKEELEKLESTVRCSCVFRVPDSPQ